MRIESVRIKNFRTFYDETVPFDSYTPLVGPNGAGKSTVLNALNVFFRQYTDSKTDLSRLSVDDFHHRDTTCPIEITVTFSDLSKSAVESLSDYVRQGKLIVTAKAKYDEGTERAEVRQYGNRLGMEEFRRWFEAEKSKAPAANLKQIYSELQEKWPDLPKATSKADMATALRTYEAEHPDSCSLIPSHDQFYGVSKGANRLEPYIQWVFVSASKDLSQEGEESKNSALGQLLLRAVRSKVDFSGRVADLKRSLQNDYKKMLSDEQSVLDSVSNSLEEKLQLWANPGAQARVHWKHDLEKSVKVEEPIAAVRLGEKKFESDLERFGHGMQRSYMLALLQEIAEGDDSDSPTLVMGIEEPELYQHPPQARYLSEVLQDLALRHSQIMVCSHSPYFIPGDDFAAVRILREEGDPPSSRVGCITYDQLNDRLESVGEKNLKEEGMLAKLYPSLRPELSEMFFCRNLVLVEGIEDVAYIQTYMHLAGVSLEFRMKEIHLVPVNGKSSIIKPLAVAGLLGIPTFVVCDGDTNKEREGEVVKHKRDNKSILSLLGYSHLSEWPEDTIAEADLRMWKTNLTDTVKDELGEDWKHHQDMSASFYGNAGGLEKNPLAISRALKTAWDEGVRSDSLISLVRDIDDFAKQEVLEQ